MEINIAEAWTILKAFRELPDSCLITRRDLDAEEQLKRRILVTVPKIVYWLGKEKTLRQLEKKLRAESCDDPTVLKLKVERDQLLLGKSYHQQYTSFEETRINFFYSIDEAQKEAFKRLWKKATGFDYCREDLIRPWRENRQNPVEKKGEAA